MTSTLYLYFLLLFVVSYLNYINTKSKDIGVFAFISFFILFLLSSLRYDIGTDYENYKSIFYTIKNQADYNTEFGYLIINKILIYFNLPFELLIAIISFLTILFIYKATSRKYLMIFIFLYIASNSYFQSFSLIRQHLAISIMLYAISNIYTTKFYKYFLWVFLASLFHLSAFLFLPVYFLKRITVNALYVPLLVFWFIIVMHTDMVNFLFEHIISMTPYGIYFGGKYFDKEIMLGSGLGIIFRLLLGAVVLFYSSRITKKFPEANIYLWLLFIYELTYILALKIYIFNRLSDTFSLFFIFAIPYFIDSFGKQMKIVLKVVFALLFLVLMYKNLLNDYYQTSGGIGVVPYISIF